MQIFLEKAIEEQKRKVFKNKLISLQLVRLLEIKIRK